MAGSSSERHHYEASISRFDRHALTDFLQVIVRGDGGYTSGFGRSVHNVQYALLAVNLFQQLSRLQVLEEHTDELGQRES